MKKITKILLLTALSIMLIGCTTKGKNIDGNLSNIMNEIYKGMPEGELPELEQTKVTKKNEEYYLGKITFSYKEALASEPVMSSIAHSVVLVRLNSSKDAEKAKKEIKEKVDPAKVNENCHFSKDLGLDSLDLVEVVMAMEEEFVVEIPDAEAEKILTTQDVINFIVAHPQAK